MYSFTVHQANHIIVNHTYITWFLLLTETISDLVSQTQVFFVNICCQNEKRKSPGPKEKQTKC